MSKIKKILTAFLVVAVLAFSAAVASADTAAPKLSLTGMDIVQITSGASPTIQVFYTLHLDGVNADTLNFTMRYDTTKLRPSNAADNTVLDASDSIALEAMFQLSDALPDGMPIFNVHSDASDPNAGYMEFLFANAADGEIIPGAQDGGVDLGQFSFELVGDVADLQSLSQADLDNMFALYNEENYPNGDPNGAPFVICYTDADGNPQEYNAFDVYWKERVTLHPQITDAVGVIANATTTAETIYNAGTVDDLYAFVAANSTSLRYTYLDGSESTESFTWDPAQCSLAAGQTYDPKGGTYTVCQTLEGGVEATIDITVDAVTVTGFLAEPADLDYKNYELAAKPTDKAGLDLPTQAKPLYDKLLTNPAAAIPAPAADAWTQTSPDPTSDEFFSSTNNNVSYVFSGTLDASDLPAWATFPASLAPATLSVTRYVGPVTADPDGISCTIDDNGNLIITVTNLGTDGVPDGTDFTVRLPDGNTVADGDVNVAIAGGVATITVAHKAAPQTVTEQYINEGGTFAIAATAPDSGRSNFVDFTAAPRDNVFTVTGTSYTFDYTGTNKTKFPYAVNQTLGTTVTLYATDYVTTTYDGITGLDDGKRQTITVDAWTKVSGDPSQLDEVVEYTGNLVAHSYTDGYGDVGVTATTIPVTLKVQTQAAAAHSVTVLSSDTTLGTASLVGAGSDFAPGATVEISYTETTGTFVKWTPDDLTYTAVAGSPGHYTFIMPNNDVTITANFSEAGAGLSGIAVHDGATEATTYDLYTDNALTAPVTTFDPATLTYFVRVPNTAESVSLWLTSTAAAPTAEYDDNDSNTTGSPEGAVTVTQDTTDTTLYKTAAISLNEVDQSLGGTDHAGFNNTVKVTVGDTEYTVHVQRLAEARIELNYGNSPYGMIMKSSNIADADKETAKQKFRESDPTNNINYNFNFADPENKYVPTDQIITTNPNHNMSKSKNYTTYAWKGVKDGDGNPINYDLNDYAIFVYAGNKFKDPGVTVYDEFGNTTTTGLTISDITGVKVMADAKAPMYDDTDLAADSANQTITLTRGANGVYDMSEKMIRPDIYEITYTYTYTPVGATASVTLTETRPVIVIGELGDSVITQYPAVTGQDGQQVINYAPTWMAKEASSHVSLFLYRICDTALSDIPAVTGQDGQWTINNCNTAPELVQYYSLLPTE